MAQAAANGVLTMIGFDTTITLYCRHIDPATRTTTWHRKTMHNASWFERRAQAGTVQGQNSTTQYDVRVNAADMPTGFVSDPNEYALLADPTGKWTARAGDYCFYGDVTVEQTDSIALFAKGRRGFVMTDANDNTRLGILPHIHLKG